MAAPDCISLNRSSCLTSGVPHTCGACLPPYLGVQGAANLACSLTAPKTAGEVCDSDVECMGVCSAGICIDVSRVCVSDTRGECSGHGTCGYQTLYGATVLSCVSSDSTCLAVCVCDEGYAGYACSSSAGSTIPSICSTLRDLVERKDPSDDLASALLGALEQSFSSDELSEDSLADCADAAAAVSLLLVDRLALTERGLESVKRAIALLSKLSVAAARLTSVSNSTLSGDSIDEASSYVLGATIASMAPGQQPLTFTSGNLQATLHNTLTSETTNRTYSTGGGAKIVLDGNGLQACPDYRNAYAAFAVSEVRAIPYVDSSTIQTTLLGWVGGRSTDNGRGRPTDGMAGRLTLVFPFVREQSLTAPSTNRFSNRTLPECVSRSGGAYLPCDCSIASYSNTSVAYSCSTLALCPSGGPATGGGSRAIERQFAVLARSVLAEVLDVLTFSDVDWATAGSVLAIFLFLVVFFFGGVTYFSRWDALDRRLLVYANRLGVDKKKRRVSAAKDEYLLSIRMRFDEVFRARGEINVSSETFEDEDVELDARHKGSWLSQAWHKMWRELYKLRCVDDNLLEKRSIGTRFVQSMLRFHPFVWFYTGVYTCVYPIYGIMFLCFYPVHGIKSIYITTRYRDDINTIYNPLSG